jgi:hypothetical protein
MALSAESLQHLRRLDQQAVVLQALAGADIGSSATVINYASNAAQVAGMQRIMADEAWQEFWARAAASGAATQVEASIYSDLDPGFAPAADRPMGVLLATQWAARPGRLTDFMGKVAQSVPHMERLGGSPRTMQCLLGAHPMTALITTAFADMDAYGAYADAIAADDQWQSFWADALSDPTAELVRTGLYLNVSGD